MCFERGVYDFLPLMSILSVDSLSWCIMLCSTLYVPLCLNEIFRPQNRGEKIINAYQLCLRGAFVFIFCPDDMLMTAPWPRVSAPPVCPLQSTCTWCAESINQFSMFKLSTLRVSCICIVVFMHCRHLTSLFQLSLSGLLTRFVRNETWVWMSRRALCDAKVAAPPCDEK